MSASRVTTQPPRKRRLIIEFELPDFYCEDIPELLDEHGPPDMDRGQEILNAIGDIHYGALTVEISGEKDSDVATVMVLARSARIEDTSPTEVEHLRPVIDRLTESSQERALEKAYGEGYDEGLADAQREVS